MEQSSKLRIKIIVGSTRRHRFGDKPAQWIYEEAKKHGNIQAEILDLRDFPMPFFDDMVGLDRGNDAVTNSFVQKWADKVEEADGYIIVTPEYNHSYPAVLKNALDFVYNGWFNKPVSFVGYGGLGGGARSVEQLRLIAIELRMTPLRNAVHIPLIWTLMGKEGSFDSSALQESSDDLFEQLIWWADALKVARAKKS